MDLCMDTFMDLRNQLANAICLDLCVCMTYLFDAARRDTYPIRHSMFLLNPVYHTVCKTSLTI